MGRQRLEKKTFGILIILDGSTSHLTPIHAKATSEVSAKIHEWMDTFHMNPKAICVDMDFHHPLTKVKSSNKKTYTMAEPRRDGCTTVQEITLGTCGYSLQKPEPDHSGTNHSCPEKTTFIKIIFIKKKVYSKSTFIKNQFHQKPERDRTLTTPSPGHIKDHELQGIRLSAHKNIRNKKEDG